MRKVELVAQARRTARSLDSLTVGAPMLTDVVRQAGAVGEPWEPRGMPEHRLRTARQLEAATRPGDPRCQVVVVSAGDIPAGGTQPFQTLKHQNTGAYAAGEAAVLEHGSPRTP